MSASCARVGFIDHLPDMRAFAISLTQDVTLMDNIVQDAVAKTRANLNQFRWDTSLCTWLFAILRNALYSARREVVREIADVHSQHAEALAEMPAHDGCLQMTDVCSAFAQLSNEQRDSLLLVGASGNSYEEAAKMRGVSLGTIKSRIGRTHQRLAKVMELDDFDTPQMTDDATLSVIYASRTPTV